MEPCTAHAPALVFARRQIASAPYTHVISVHNSDCEMDKVDTNQVGHEQLIPVLIHHMWLRPPCSRLEGTLRPAVSCNGLLADVVTKNAFPPSYCAPLVNQSKSQVVK